MTNTPRSQQLALVPAYRTVPRLLDGRAAQAAVTVQAASNLYNSPVQVDYPVSADETLRAYGYVGIRQRHVNIWNSVELLGVFDELDELV